MKMTVLEFLVVVALLIATNGLTFLTTYDHATNIVLQKIASHQIKMCVKTNVVTQTNYTYTVKHEENSSQD